MIELKTIYLFNIAIDGIRVGSKHKILNSLLNIQYGTMNVRFNLNAPKHGFMCQDTKH
jgi:hypothetical protein